MRILHILNELRPSGAETMLNAAASYWRAQGINGEILCTGEQLGEYASVLRDSGYTIHHVPFQRSLFFLITVCAFLWRSRFDAVHIHTERANFWYAALACVSGHRRIVRTIHSVFPFRGTLRLRRCAQRLLMRRLLGVRMAACSESVRLQEWSSYRNPVTLISNWFDNARYRPALAEERTAARAAFAIDTRTLVVCSVGNCGPAKNHGAILSAVATLNGRIPIVYLHVGDERYGDGEKRLAVDLGIAEQVRFLGPQLALRAALHASDVFVMPSLYEGFGIAAVEAMGAGVPTVLSEVEGLKDFRDMDASIYWTEPTATGVEAALVHLHQMGADGRQRLGLGLSASAHARFAVSRGSTLYAALYRGELPISFVAKAAASC